METRSLKFLVLGHITSDVVTEGFRLGGAATYAALAASRLGCQVRIVTSAGPALDLESPFPDIEVCCLDAPAATTFRNLYTKEGREQFVLAVASRITSTDIPPSWLDADIVLLAPVAQELDPHLVQVFPKSLIGVSPQGWMRAWDDQGLVHYKEWEWAAAVLPHIEVLILSEEDIGGREVLVAEYIRQVPSLVLTQGEKGARVHCGGRWHQVPAFSVNAGEPTGAGDVFAASYLIYYTHTREAVAAARFANCVASFLIEGGLANLPTMEQVEKRLSLCGRDETHRLSRR